MHRAPFRASQPMRRTLHVLLLVLMIVSATAGGLQWIYNFADVSDGPMLMAGRRGDVARWPENTLEGVLSAARMDADAIEMDVRRSADGTFFLMHDSDVSRTTDGSGRVEEMTDELVERLRIDGGLGYSGQQGLRVPRLSAVLAALGTYDGLLLMDAKGSPADHADLAGTVGTNVRAWISCGSASDVAAVDGQLPTYGPGGIGADFRIADSPLGLDAFFNRAEVSPIYWWWTGSEVAPMERARRWGVKVYITNDIHAAMSWSRQ